MLVMRDSFTPFREMDGARFFCTYLRSTWKLLQVEHMLADIHVIGCANAWKVTQHERMGGADAGCSACVGNGHIRVTLCPCPPVIVGLLELLGWRYGAIRGPSGRRALAWSAWRARGFGR